MGDEKIKQMKTELGGSVLNEIMKLIGDKKVMYLDCLSFENFDVPCQIPRISVWKGLQGACKFGLDIVALCLYSSTCVFVAYRSL
ncbi:unnamed protein product [Urochloa humidicola]